MEYRAKLNSLDVILRYSINKIVRRYSIDGNVIAINYSFMFTTLKKCSVGQVLKI